MPVKHHAQDVWARDFLDRLFFPLLGLLVAALGVLPTLLLLGRPSIEAAQWKMGLAGLLIAAIGLSRAKPWSFLRYKLASYGVGARELALIAIVTLTTLVIVDVALNVLLPPIHQPADLGWNTRPDKAQIIIEDTPGRKRRFYHQHFRYGFKRWPDKNTANRRTIIIGDSMTEMIHVANGEEWYAYLESAFDDIDFYVFGSGGYGSLQEFMILDRYVDEISPDVVVWQFCHNDYANNFYGLDLETYPISNHAYRPYLENGKIVYRLPLPFLAARRGSFIADRALAIYDRLRFKQFLFRTGGQSREEASPRR